MKVRHCFSEIWKWIHDPEILFLIGPRQVGKTTLLQQMQKKIEEDGLGKTFFYTFEDFAFLQECNKSPKNLLADLGTLPKNQKVFVFLDEVQYLDDPSRFLKYLFDTHKTQIKFVVSGSSAFYMDTKFTDSLAGRKMIFPIVPFSFPEFLFFKNNTIPEDFSKLPAFRRNEYFLLLQEYALFGGYPRVVLEEDLGKKKMILNDLIQSFLKKDVLEQNVRNIQKFYEFLRLLSDTTGQLYNRHKISTALGISTTAAQDYGTLLEKTFFIAFLPPFHKNIKKELTKMPKVFFVDSGIRNSLLKNFASFSDRSDRGELFEQVMFQVFCEKNEELYFWNTQSGQEIDFIFPQKKQAVEVKWSLQKTGKNRHRDAFLKGYPDFLYEEVCAENVWRYL